MKSLSTDALYLISDYMHAGWPKDEIDIQRFRRADCSDWSLWDGREACTGSVRDAIKADEKIRELIDWDDLKDSSCMTEDELIDEIAFQCWNWYWGCKVDSGEMDEIEKNLKEEETMKHYSVFTRISRAGTHYAISRDDSETPYFAGYDFMGGANWEADINKAFYTVSRDEAEQIAQDLTDGEPEEEEQTMKYTVANEDGCKTVLKTNSIVEALKARDAFDEENPWLCPTGIFDEENRAVDPDRDWDTFVMDVIDELSEMECICGVASLSLEGAQHQLDDWKASGIRVPEGLTAEILQYLWNSWLTQYVAAYAEAQQTNDDASYQETVREAASFEAIDVDDLDDILREDQSDDDFTVDPDEYFEDPLMKQLQMALDAAVADRDETGNRWKALTEEPGATELECHRAYTRYEHSQGYLEGLTNGIFAAGYNIRTDVDTTKMTVTK